jgi:hypothetical protein
LTPEQQIANNALPSHNHANRGVEVAVGEDTLALVTRVGDQRSNTALGRDGNPRFGPNTPGGGWQLQFLNEGSVQRRLVEVEGDTSALPPGITRLNPGEFRSNVVPFGPTIGLLDILGENEEEQNWTWEEVAG